MPKKIFLLTLLLCISAPTRVHGEISFRLFSKKKRLQRKIRKNSLVIETGENQSQQGIDQNSPGFPFAPPKMKLPKAPKPKPATVIEQEKTNQLILISERKINNSLNGFNQSIKKLAQFVFHTSQKSTKNEFTQTTYDAILKTATITSISDEVNLFLQQIRTALTHGIEFHEKQRKIRKRYSIRIQYELSKLALESTGILSKFKRISEETLKSYAITVATITGIKKTLENLSGPVNNYSVIVLRDMKNKFSQLEEELKTVHHKINLLELQELELNNFINELSDY